MSGPEDARCNQVGAWEGFLKCPSVCSATQLSYSPVPTESTPTAYEAGHCSRHFTHALCHSSSPHIQGNRSVSASVSQGHLAPYHASNLWTLATSVSHSQE